MTLTKDEKNKNFQNLINEINNFNAVNNVRTNLFGKEVYVYYKPALLYLEKRIDEYNSTYINYVNTLKEFKNLQLLNDNDKTIHIVCGVHTRTNSWLHNRDWDHMCISNKQGMKLWCEYYNFLKYEPPYTFTTEIRFNNNGFWRNTENNDKSIIATQLFFQYIVENNFKLNFDTLNIFTTLIR